MTPLKLYLFLITKWHIWSCNKTDSIPFVFRLKMRYLNEWWYIFSPIMWSWSTTILVLQAPVGLLHPPGSIIQDQYIWGWKCVAWRLVKGLEEAAWLWSVWGRPCLCLLWVVSFVPFAQLMLDHWTLETH